MYPYGWFMLMFGKNQQNSVKQLSFEKKEKKEKKRIIKTSHNKKNYFKKKKKKKNTFWYIRANKGWRNSCWWRKQMFPNSLSWFLINNADQCQSILRERYIHWIFFFLFWSPLRNKCACSRNKVKLKSEKNTGYKK